MSEERDSLQATFDLRWKADMRAIKRWQKATGKDLTWPDHADLVVWLLERQEELVEALEGFVRAYDRVYPVRTANMHKNGCLCMRCHRDQAANLIAKHRERSDD